MASNRAVDFDDILMELANKIPDKNMKKLGKELGLDAVEIERYVATNVRYQKVTCDGTLDMLRDWDNKQTKATEQAALKKALVNAGLDRLADNFFPIGGTGDSSTMLPSSTMTQGTHLNRSDQRKVSDGEIIKLSKIVPHDSYMDVCVALGFSITQSKHIQAQHHLDCIAAGNTILNMWRAETGGFTQDLDEALNRVKLGGLIDQYKM